MGVDDRFFEPPAADADKVAARLARLAPEVQLALARSGEALQANDLATARGALSIVLAAAPQDPDVLRMQGVLLAQAGEQETANSYFDAALQGVPDDAVTFWQYAYACETRGDVRAAFDLRRRAIEQAPQSPLAWTDLGEHLLVYASASAALVPLERAVELAPRFEPALLKLGYAYTSVGRVDDGAQCFRAALKVNPAFVPAWAALVDIKTIRPTATEIERMRELLRTGSSLLAGERIALEYALALACEAAGLYAEAWERAVHANTLRKQELPDWDRVRFTRQEQQSADVFSRPHPGATNPDLGRGIIFVVGMLRSGTTLAEQILASHPNVKGAGELAAIPNVLTEESERRQRQYPEWAADASAADWQRLGERYLALTDGLRAGHAFLTDKLPGNWRALGAVRAMLPGARIVVCQRGSLENCWSCFKQYFLHGSAYTNDINDLALYWHAFDRATKYWIAAAPERVYAQGYERLTANPEPEIRALLDFCGLDFDERCLHPQTLQRSVRTLSAAQVRRPIYPSRGTAEAYGALLDPLRCALGLSPLG
jgi:tetratricopeptide (TPR) repeat protein